MPIEVSHPQIKVSAERGNYSLGLFGTSSGKEDTGSYHEL
jgi:hypothetical protein